MPIGRINGTFDIHGLQLKTEAELVDFVTKVRKAIRDLHPTLRVESDVEFEIESQYGDLEP